MAFKSDKQRKCVMAQLKKAQRLAKAQGFSTVKGDVTKTEIRFRQANPKQFDRIRQVDTGKKGSMVLNIGFKNNQSIVQSVRFKRKDL